MVGRCVRCGLVCSVCNSLKLFIWGMLRLSRIRLGKGLFVLVCFSSFSVFRLLCVMSSLVWIEEYFSVIFIRKMLVVLFLISSSCSGIEVCLGIGGFWKRFSIG